MTDAQWRAVCEVVPSAMRGPHREWGFVAAADGGASPDNREPLQRPRRPQLITLLQHLSTHGDLRALRSSLALSHAAAHEGGDWQRTQQSILAVATVLRDEQETDGNVAASIESVAVRAAVRALTFDDCDLSIINLALLMQTYFLMVGAPRGLFTRISYGINADGDAARTAFEPDMTYIMGASCWAPIEFDTESKRYWSRCQLSLDEYVAQSLIRIRREKKFAERDVWRTDDGIRRLVDGIVRGECRPIVRLLHAVVSAFFPRHSAISWRGMRSSEASSTPAVRRLLADDTVRRQLALYAAYLDCAEQEADVSGSRRAVACRLHDALCLSSDASNRACADAKASLVNARRASAANVRDIELAQAKLAEVRSRSRAGASARECMEACRAAFDWRAVLESDERRVRDYFDAQREAGLDAPSDRAVALLHAEHDLPAMAKLKLAVAGRE